MGNIADISEVLLELGLSASATDEERAIVSTSIVRAEGAVRRHLKYDPLQRTRTEFYPQMGQLYEARRSVWESEGDQAIRRYETLGAGDQLQVQHVPIRSITSLFIDYDARSGTRSGSFAAETLKVEGTDYWPNFDGEDDDGNSICRDGIIRSYGAWPITPGTVKIVYVAGYTMEELHGQKTVVDASPILEAIIQESVRRTKKAFVSMKQSNVGFVPGTITSEKLGDYAYTLGGSGAGGTMDRMFGGLWDILPETELLLGSFMNWGWSLSG